MLSSRFPVCAIITKAPEICVIGNGTPGRSTFLLLLSGKACLGRAIWLCDVCRYALNPQTPRNAMHRTKFGEHRRNNFIILRTGAHVILGVLGVLAVAPDFVVHHADRLSDLPPLESQSLDRPWSKQPSQAGSRDPSVSGWYSQGTKRQGYLGRDYY